MLKPIIWNRPYGWRAGPRYLDPALTASAVIRYEQTQLENALDVPDFVLDELDRQHVKAAEVVWVCRTREHARRYGGPGLGQPYKEPLGPSSLILATDGESEMGYLVLRDASRMDPSVIQRFAHYCQSRSVERGAGLVE